MKNIKFITTFSKSGYEVYGKTWIQSFLDKTKNYNNITAELYVDEVPNLDNLDKITFYNYQSSIPEREIWQNLFVNNSIHDQWNKDLAIKFSFKSFVMIHALKNTNDGYVIWLDADCIFLGSSFDNWPEILLKDTFVACQREYGCEHVESGIIIFDSNHNDKQKYVDKFESLYMIPSQFNAFGQFFDGYAVGRTLDTINIPYVNLNENYGIGGIQSDPGCTFLNPEIKSRFSHNIGITGKRQYQDWEKYKHDPFFQLIHGVNDLPPEEKRKKNLEKINHKINRLSRINIK
jgi:hypothetical protein